MIPLFGVCSTAYLCSQVADLDDQFAELLLTDFSDNFDAIPSSKVSVLVLGLNTGWEKKQKNKLYLRLLSCRRLYGG